MAIPLQRYSTDPLRVEVPRDGKLFICILEGEDGVLHARLFRRCPVRKTTVDAFSR